MKINQKSWAILSPDERTALGLQHGMNKSSWQSGEIMVKSHYKYLEIKYRAEKYLAMFTEHLELYKELIPEYITGEAAVINYFKWCMGERLKPMDAIARLNDNNYDRVYTKVRLNEKIVTQLKKWRDGQNVYELAIFNLVKEFDRWNNFRILPREVQEPSAFKRRIKNMYKKHIRVLTSMPGLSFDKLMELTRVSSNRHDGAWLPILNKKKQIEVVKVKTNRNTMGLFNDLCLYLFKDKDQAKDYITSIYHYVNKGKKDCKDGIEFWQQYRDCIKCAQNYYDVQKITATRSHLELAYEKLEYF